MNKNIIIAQSDRKSRIVIIETRNYIEKLESFVKDDKTEEKKTNLQEIQSKNPKI